MLTLYGHPISSFTWKVLTALYEDSTPFKSMKQSEPLFHMYPGA